ncbi:MAG TPA: LuxR C-terminal-related transcriptional regulator [Streptosporangiaceae bacterium]|nr:LuxR C-terminal-related transcriptional regulator [Streptosporangiaceae bacterium]
MSVDTRRAASPAPELGQLLLDAKFTVPRPRPGAVSRAGLVEAARSSGRRLVALTAPAGYGKSTFLAQWAQAEDRRVAWVSLDRFDDDPAMLLVSLAAAYGRVDPGCADLVADMRGPGISVLGRAAPRLVSVLSTSPVPFVFVLDDLHELQSPVCHDVLGMVITAIPEGSQVAAASRSEQPHLPRLRASGDAMEFGSGDLALDAVGARQIFATAKVRVTPERVAAVTERTEGWPAGLYLAALIIRDSHGQESAVTGDDRYVADYLYREVLMRQPEDMRRFLRRTAVLDQLCGPLCDAVLGSSDAAGQLRRLEAASLFLIPLDRHRHWYRYHALFREFLLAELGRAEPGLVMTLHQRAADWYEASGSPILALEHLLDTTDRDRSVRLATALALPTYNAGQMSTVQRWYRAIGDADIERYPPLAVLRCWEAVLTGDTAGTERWAAVLDAASFEGTQLNGSASFDSARAIVRAAMCASGPEQMMADAAFAVAQEPAWSPWHAEALWVLGEAHLLFAHPDEARAVLVEASVAATTTGNADTIVICESELALLAADRSQWQEAAGRLKRALATIDEHRLHDYVTCLLAFAEAARQSVHRGELTEARRQLTRAMRARPSATYAFPWAAVRLRVELAKVCFSIAEVVTARQLLREIDDILTHRPALGTLTGEVEEFRRVLASSAAGVTGRSALTPAELRLLPYLQTHLTANGIAERLFVSSHTVKAEVKSIYRKLGVSSRHDAVQKATAMGLLGT